MSNGGVFEYACFWREAEALRVGDRGAALSEGGSALDRLGWQAFDVVEFDGHPAPATLEARAEALLRQLEGCRRASPV